MENEVTETQTERQTDREAGVRVTHAVAAPQLED